MKYLTVASVLRIHSRVIATSGGRDGVRDLDRVDAAVTQPRMKFGGEPLYPTLASKAAALAFILNMGHPFLDGNKRTAHAAMEMFLLRNGHEIEAPVDEQELIFLGVASGEIGQTQFAEWVESCMIARKR